VLPIIENGWPHFRHSTGFYFKSVLHFRCTSTSGVVLFLVSVAFSVHVCIETGSTSIIAIHTFNHITFHQKSWPPYNMRYNQLFLFLICVSGVRNLSIEPRYSILKHLLFYTGRAPNYFILLAFYIFSQNRLQHGLGFFPDNQLFPVRVTLFTSG